MKAIILIGAAALGLASTSAQAQDLSGFRIEGRVGWDQTGVKAAVPNPDEDEDETGDEFLVASEDDDGVIYGVELGYDAQIGDNFVVGAYGGLDFSDTSICSELIEDDLASLGFGLMRLSGRTVAIKSIPTDLPPDEARNLFAEILDHVELDKRGQAKQTIRDDIAASLACKAAVKINMKLTPEKMQWLIDRLLLTSSPTTCPHGRPVILRLTMKDIERGFHRT